MSGQVHSHDPFRCNYYSGSSNINQIVYFVKKDNKNLIMTLFSLRRVEIFFPEKSIVFERWSIFFHLSNCKCITRIIDYSNSQTQEQVNTENKKKTISKKTLYNNFVLWKTALSAVQYFQDLMQVVIFWHRTILVTNQEFKL